VSRAADPALRVRADRAACRGARACVRRAPGTFSLDAERRVVVASSPTDDVRAIASAVAACPNFALVLERPQDQ
jgi:ferredoxin